MKKAEGYFEVFLVVFLVGLFIALIWDFIFPLLFASSLVFLFYKPYLYVLKVVRSKNLAALIMTGLLISLVVAPLYFLAQGLFEESKQLVTTGLDVYENFDIEDCEKGAVCSYIYDGLRFLNIGADQLVTKVSSWFSTSYNVIFSSLWNLAIDLCIFILGFFFLLRDGERFVQFLKRIVPMKDSYKEALFLKFKDVSAAVFIDSLFIAMFQGFLVGIGFYFTGFEAPVFWAIIASFLALLPFFGATLVWAPAGLYLIATNEYILGIGLLLYGTFIIGTSDNLLRPLLMKTKVEVHAFVIFLAILGGISLFGFFGIFLGPLIVSLLITVIQLYRLEFH